MGLALCRFSSCVFIQIKSRFIAFLRINPVRFWQKNCLNFDSKIQALALGVPLDAPGAIASHSQ